MSIKEYMNDHPKNKKDSNIKVAKLDKKRFNMYRDLRNKGYKVRRLNKYLRPGEASSFSLKYRQEDTP